VCVCVCVCVCVSAALAAHMRSINHVDSAQSKRPSIPSLFSTWRLSSLPFFPSAYTVLQNCPPSRTLSRHHGPPLVVRRSLLLCAISHFPSAFSSFPAPPARPPARPPYFLSLSLSFFSFSVFFSLLFSPWSSVSPVAQMRRSHATQTTHGAPICTARLM